MRTGEGRWPRLWPQPKLQDPCCLVRGGGCVPGKRVHPPAGTSHFGPANCSVASTQERSSSGLGPPCSWSPGAFSLDAAPHPQSVGGDLILQRSPWAICLAQVRWAPLLRLGGGSVMWCFLFRSSESFCTVWVYTVQTDENKSVFKASLCPGAGCSFFPRPHSGPSLFLLIPEEWKRGWVWAGRWPGCGCG